MMDALWAVPEWAPEDESHLLGSLSVVAKISYGAGRVTYSTFDKESTDVLRLDFVPDAVSVGGKAVALISDLKKDSNHDGYSFDEKTHVLRVRHVSSRDVDIEGSSDRKPAQLVTFDDPHLAAGTALAGQYPSGVIDWSGVGKGQWEIGTPSGKFGTFTLMPSDAKTQRVGFDFYSPRIFAGVDVYNHGESDATVTVSSPETREIAFTIKPKELRRIRTNWRDPSSRVWFALVNGSGLRFDNLAYVHP
jgi:hypothetical protein